MKTIEIPIAPTYVGWGVWECVREILQNALDAHDRGYEMSISWKERGSGPVLVVANQGATLTRDKLRLGGTDKHGDPASRGQFGEGMKLAWMRLLALGYGVWVRVGDERWVPRIGASETFGGGEVLCIDIGPVKDRNDVCVEVRGVEKDDWEMIQSRMLALAPPEKSAYITTTNGSMLLGDKYRGRLYSKGIFVTHLPGTWEYGFDLGNVELDRDRNVPDQWSLRREIRECFKKALVGGALSTEEVIDTLNGETDESSALESIEFDSSADSEAFCKNIADEYVRKYGEKVCPVTSLSEAETVRQNGLTPVIVSRSIKLVLERALGCVQSRVSKSVRSITKVYQIEELDPNALGYLMLLCDLIHGIEPEWNREVRVVEYVGKSVMGGFESGPHGARVSLSHSAFMDRGEAVATLVHEVAHLYGSDGTESHRAAEERIFSGIISALMP
jgi:hypothetical protein